MAQVSKRIINEGLYNHIFNMFIKNISELKDESEIKSFLEDLLSPTERIMIVKRLAIAILLVKGYSYREIDEKLKVSKPTITKVAFWLRYGKSGYQTVIKRYIDTQKKEDLLDKIEELLIKLGPPKAYGSIGFTLKQQKGRELFQRKRKRNLL